MAAWLQRALMPLFVRLMARSTGWMYRYRVAWDEPAGETKKAA